MKYKIIVDSSSNLTKDYLVDDEIGFDVAPLTLNIAGKEYVDDGVDKADEVLEALNSTKEKATSSCPSTGVYLEMMSGATYYIVITLTEKLSGSYNSALVAKSMHTTPNNVFVLDSKLVCGALRILVNKAVELIKSGLNFEEIQKQLTIERDKGNLLFVLDKFDNFIKSGRINKLVGFLASKLAIKPLCYGDNGEIKIMAKIRTFPGVIKKLVVEIGSLCKETKDRICVISHTCNEKFAKVLKDLISKAYHFKEVIIEKNRALCSFYALEGGIIVSF